MYFFYFHTGQGSEIHSFEPHRIDANSSICHRMGRTLKRLYGLRKKKKAWQMGTEKQVKQQRNKTDSDQPCRATVFD